MNGSGWISVLLHIPLEEQVKPGYKWISVLFGDYT